MLRSLLVTLLTVALVVGLAFAAGYLYGTTDAPAVKCKRNPAPLITHPHQEREVTI